MAYLMDNPEGLEGTREVSQIREIRLYPKGDDYVAKVEILMKIKILLWRIWSITH